MKAAPPEKPTKPSPFDCDAYRRWITANIERDIAARARINAAGDTLH